MGKTALRVILAFSIVSTALHFTHNYLRIEQYPQVPAISAATTQVTILISWPVLTIVGRADAARQHSALDLMNAS